MMQTPFIPRRLSRLAAQKANQLKVIVFPVASYWLALPINAVLKVILSPPITTTADSDRHGLGMVDVDRQTVTVINLHQHLKPSTGPQPLHRRFLILTQTRQGELCGIPVDAPPVLMELSLEAIRPLPATYRQSDPLGMASHMALLQEEEGERQIYLLGMQKLLMEKQGNA